VRQRILALMLAAAGMPALAQEAPDGAASADGAEGADAVESTAPVVSAGARAAGAAPADEVAALAPAVDTSAGAVRQVAIDRLDLGTTSITGNQELPKVLYIVPWKRSDLGDLIGRPVNTLLDEVLAPVDRRVFERHLSYYETLHGESQEE